MSMPPISCPLAGPQIMSTTHEKLAPGSFFGWRDDWISPSGTMTTVESGGRFFFAPAESLFQGMLGGTHLQNGALAAQP
jgi:hypothetical protein